MDRIKENRIKYKLCCMIDKETTLETIKRYDSFEEARDDIFNFVGDYKEKCIVFVLAEETTINYDENGLFHDSTVKSYRVNEYCCIIENGMYFWAPCKATQILDDTFMPFDEVEYGE